MPPEAVLVPGVLVLMLVSKVIGMPVGGGTSGATVMAVPSAVRSRLEATEVDELGGQVSYMMSLSLSLLEMTVQVLGPPPGIVHL